MILHRKHIFNLQNNINYFPIASPVQILALILHLYAKEMNMNIQSEEGIKHENFKSIQIKVNISFK